MALAGHSATHRAQIDPQGLVTFFETLKQEEEKKLKELAGEDNSELAKGTLSLLSTHPATDDRIAQLRDLIAGQPHQRQRDLQPDFANLQTAVKAFVTHTDTHTEKE